MTRLETFNKSMKPNPIMTELRTIRRGLKISRNKLSDRAGYDRSVILRGEMGQNLPRLETVCNWAEALGYKLVLVKK